MPGQGKRGGWRSLLGFQAGNKAFFLYLFPVKTYQPHEIKEIRLRYRVSQAVFAAYLNVSKTSVASWESGGKKPGPAVAKLLNLVDRKDIQAVA